jgi:hypothetical protein
MVWETIIAGVGATDKSAQLYAVVAHTIALRRIVNAGTTARPIHFEAASVGGLSRSQVFATLSTNNLRSLTNLRNISGLDVVLSAQRFHDARIVRPEASVDFGRAGLNKGLEGRSDESSQIEIKAGNA